jgi:Fe-S-cluster containining protein
MVKAQWPCDPNCPPETDAQSKNWFELLTTETEAQLIACLKKSREDQAADHVAQTVQSRSEEIKSSTFRKLTELRQAGKKIPPVACRMGCNYCCHLQVSCHVPETIRIAEHLRKTRTAKELAALATKMEQHSNLRAGLSKKQKASGNVAPCPFLGSQGECTIYEVRPLVCRTYHSFNAVECKAAFDNPDKKLKVTMVLEPCDTRDALTFALVDACEKLKIPSHEVELVAAVRIALENPEASTRWRRGEDVFAKARV